MARPKKRLREASPHAMLNPDSFKTENKRAGKKDKISAASCIMPMSSVWESLGMRFIKMVVSMGLSHPKKMPQRTENPTAVPMNPGPVKKMEAPVVDTIKPALQIMADLTGLLNHADK